MKSDDDEYLFCPLNFLDKNSPQACQYITVFSYCIWLSNDRRRYKKTKETIFKQTREKTIGNSSKLLTKSQNIDPICSHVHKKKKRHTHTQMNAHAVRIVYRRMVNKRQGIYLFVKYNCGHSA